MCARTSGRSPRAMGVSTNQHFSVSTLRRMRHPEYTYSRAESTAPRIHRVGHAPARSNAPVATVPYLQSVIPTNRLRFLADICRQALQRSPGHVLEVGVYRGGSLGVLAQVVNEVCPRYRVIGVDTFSGHPYSDNHPVHPQGKYADVDTTVLRTALDGQVYGSLVDLHRGRVEAILDSLNLDNIAFAHIDCDLYLPVRHCAQEVPRLMKPDGCIYFDDYGHEHCPGATRAVLEVFPSRALHEVYMPDDRTCWSCHFRLDELA